MIDDRDEPVREPDREANRIVATDDLCLTANAPPMLQDVERAYAIKDHAETVAEVFVKGSGLDPFEVFRWHEAEEDDVIEEPDITYRVALDSLIGGLSALHAGGLGVSGGATKHTAHGDTVWSLLSEPAVVPYYERYYPYAPAILAREAMGGVIPLAYRGAWAREVEQPSFAPAYRRFLHLDARFLSNDEIAAFVDLLDDYLVGDDHLSDLRDALERPKRLAQWLEKERRWRLLEGMGSFFELAQDLDEMLRETELPVLRGHVWLHFAYWFGSGGQRMLEVAEWLVEAARNVEGKESDETAARLQETLKRLRDPKGYPAKLLDLTDELLEPWMQSSGVGKGRNRPMELNA